MSNTFCAQFRKLQRHSSGLICYAASTNIVPNSRQLFTQFHPFSGHNLKLAATGVPFCKLLHPSQNPRSCNLILSCNTNLHSASRGSDNTAKGKESAEEMSKPVISNKVKTAKAEAVWGLFVADAIAMPVHWYYNTKDIKKDYGGWLTDYVAPKEKHPSSILTVSAVDSSGRGSTSSESSIIGDIILHDKLKYWQGTTSNNHYHQGMKAGDSTLNAVMALQELQSMNGYDPDFTRSERDVRGAVLENYVKFMTTPGSHNDTYAESFHRAFFRDWVASGKPTESTQILEFAEIRSKKMLQERPDTQLAVIGSLVPAIPWIVRNAHKSRKDCAQSVVDFIKLTHPVHSLIPYLECYSHLLHAVLNGSDLKSEIMNVLGHSIFGGPTNRDMMMAVTEALQKIPKGSEEKLKQYQNVVSTLGSSCYIEGALKSMLFLALEFHDDFEAGILTNTNCGGENCHRGAALGTLLAANQGAGVPTKFKDGLNSMKSQVELVVQDMNRGL